VKIVVPQILL